MYVNEIIYNTWVVWPVLCDFRYAHKLQERRQFDPQLDFPKSNQVVFVPKLNQYLFFNLTKLQLSDNMNII